MLEKLKKIILPIMLGFFMYNAAESTILVQNQTEVYADIPAIKIENGKLDLTPIKPKTSDEFFKTALKQYRKVIIFVSGIGTLSMILFFILNFIKLGGSQGNPQERQKAVTGIIVAGIATACLGSVTAVVGMFYNML